MKGLLAVMLIGPLTANAQGGRRGNGAAQPAVDAAKPVPEAGIPVTDPLVISKCSPCHKADEKGNLTRISWERTNPEGWQEAIKRMVRLNGLDLKPEEARAIVKSLSATHGLAPEEAKPVMYFVEHRIVDEVYPSDMVREACGACHPIGRARSWHRSKEEWDLLVAMHRGYFMVAEQSFQRGARPPGAPVPPPQPGVDTRPAVDQAIDYLSKSYPLTTPTETERRAFADRRFGWRCASGDRGIVVPYSAARLSDSEQFR